MFRSILIPTDFTPVAWNALQLGIQLVMRSKAKISLVHVYPTEEGGDKPDAKKLKNLKEKMEKMCEEISAEKKLDLNSSIVSGNVHNELKSFINTNEFDLIIMGVNSNGDTNSPGRHTVRCIEKSSVPILVVPNNYSFDS